MERTGGSVGEMDLEGRVTDGAECVHLEWKAAVFRSRVRASARPMWRGAAGRGATVRTRRGEWKSRVRGDGNRGGDRQESCCERGKLA